jgi:hypothetical protein
MLHVKALALSSLIALSSTQGYAQSQPEISPEMATFMGWEESVQEAFIANGVVMIAVVATQVSPNTARCIDDWYGSQPDARKQEIRNIMDDFRRFTPESVILAYIEKACGQLPRPN